ncbi:MAG: hypothetical protein QW666_03605 [Candidatus Woesearchaeota archaeon]
MRKKGDEPVSHTAVWAIAAVIALVVLLFIVPELGKKLYAAGSKGECEWNVLVSALTRTPGLGFENIPVECKAKYRNVTMADLQANYPSAEKMMDIYKKKNYPIANIFNNPSDKLQLAEWSMDKIVADEMVECWDKVWHGEMPLFDVWYRLIDYKKDVIDTLSDDQLKEVEANKIPIQIEKMSMLDYLKVWNIRFKEPPIFCIVCARLKFDDDVKKQFATKPTITSLTHWLMSNPVPGTSENYYLYILPDWLKNKIAQQYSYNVNEPIAIVYARINMHKIATVTDPIVTLLGLQSKDEAQDKADKIIVVPYDKVILPFEKNGANCHYVLD